MPNSDGNAPEAAFHRPMLLRCLVLVFVVWHALTVAAFALPVTAESPRLRSLRDRIFPIVAPYGYLFSQWQDWRMFVAPDPFQFTRVKTVELLHGPLVISARFLTTEEAANLSDAVATNALLAEFCAHQTTEKDARIRIVLREYFDRTGHPVTLERLAVPGAANDRSLNWYQRIEGEARCSLVASSW